MKKCKPLLHRVSGNRDPELFQTDLEWFFGCLPSICGIKSVSDMSHLLEMSPANYRANSNIADSNDDHPEEHSAQTFVAKASKAPLPDTGRQEDMLIGALDALARGRRVWARLNVIPWPQQELLRAFYEPRREQLEFEESKVRCAHKAYMEAR